MTDNINVNSNLKECINTFEEVRSDPAGDTVPFFEEIVVVKTEVTEEAEDIEMPVTDIEFVNVKEEHIRSPEALSKVEDSDFTNDSEHLLNENLGVGDCGKKELHLKNLSQKDLVEKVLSKYAIERTDIRAPIRKDLFGHRRSYVVDKPFKCTYKYCKCIPGQEEFCKCNMCKFASTNEYKLTNHILAKHNAEMYKCTDCEYTTRWKHNLPSHILARHNTEPKKLSEKAKKFKCKDCDYATHRKAYLVVHIRKHSGEKPFKCTYKICKCAPEQEEACKCKTCGHATTIKGNLDKHILVKHSLEPQEYKCKDCDYATHSKVYLMIHSRNHSGEKPFACTYKNCKCTPKEKESCKCKKCQFATTSQSNLNTHILAKHSAERNRYKCKDCDYATHSKVYITVHSRTHTGEKPFKCTYKHCRCKPGQKRTCKCNTCGFASADKYYLKKHILAKHSDQKS